MTARKASKKLSEQGLIFLRDPLMYEALCAVAASVGATPEEYLLRFEEILLKKPKEIFDAFGALASKA